jgi:enolase
MKKEKERKEKEERKEEKITICGIYSREILDSRGNPTVEVDVVTNCSFGRASTPSGASKGEREAIELRDGGKRFSGKGVRKAVQNVIKIGKYLIGKDPRKQSEIDNFIAKKAGENKKKIGGNATTALSLAICSAAAASLNSPIYKYLNERARTLPIPLLNVINGGKHAGNDLAIQEFLIVPIHFNSFRDAITGACEVYYQLGKILKEKYGKISTNVGDEGGYAPPLRFTKDALDVIERAIDECGYSKKIFLALDCAASNFYNGKEYLIDEKKIARDELLDYYKSLVSEYKIVSIEDPFEENDFDGFALAKSLKIQIIGDDIFTSNIKYLKKGIQMGSANAILLKINQVGTLTEAIETAKCAMENNYAVVVSHRSGETESTFIADFAVALECGQIKTGAPARGERVAKYNQLLRIEEELENPKYAEWGW